jgi:hypothetical protein
LEQRVQHVANQPVVDVRKQDRGVNNRRARTGPQLASEEYFEVCKLGRRQNPFLNHNPLGQNGSANMEV